MMSGKVEGLVKLPKVISLESVSIFRQILVKIKIAPFQPFS